VKAWSPLLVLLLLAIPSAIAGGKKAVSAATAAHCSQFLVPLDLDDEVSGLDLGNTHEVIGSPGRIIRGHEPGKNVKELTDLGVTDVVIYKNDVKGEVAKEVEDLKTLGVPADQIHTIAMPWKGIKDPEVPCRQTVEALNLLLGIARTPGRIGYFHCSAGQDRTGMLAGLLRITAQGWSAEKAFYTEMCGHGYGFGDTKRPASVSGTVETNLTPIFLQLAAGIREHSFTLASTIDTSLCHDKPKAPLDETSFKCK
jgi:hypothetical protein